MKGSKGTIAFEGMAKWIVFLIIILVFIAIFVIFGKQIVDYMINNAPWRAAICDPSVSNC